MRIQSHSDAAKEMYSWSKRFPDLVELYPDEYQEVCETLETIESSSIELGPEEVKRIEKDLNLCEQKRMLLIGGTYGIIIYFVASGLLLGFGHLASGLGMMGSLVGIMHVVKNNSFLSDTMNECQEKLKILRTLGIEK